MGQPRPLYHIFLSFQTHITNFTTNRYVKKCPSSIWCQDSNSRHLEDESPLITTRPGLPPYYKFTFVKPISYLTYSCWTNDRFRLVNSERVLKLSMIGFEPATSDVESHISANRYSPFKLVGN